MNHLSQSLLLTCGYSEKIPGYFFNKRETGRPDYFWLLLSIQRIEISPTPPTCLLSSRNTRVCKRGSWSTKSTEFMFLDGERVVHSGYIPEESAISEWLGRRKIWGANRCTTSTPRLAKGKIFTGVYRPTDKTVQKLNFLFVNFILFVSGISCWDQLGGDIYQ